MLTVGVTGGIGSGKSSAANRFRQLGVPVIDADLIARQIVEPGMPALQEIINAFGESVANDQGELDRSALRKIIFSDSNRKSQLEAILHPRIYNEILRLLSELSTPYAIVVIPLLAESKREYPLDRILVIDVPSDVQISRVTTRDNQSTEEVEQIISSQASRHSRLEIADDIIENVGSTDDLYERVDAMHLTYLEYARKSNQTVT